VARAPRWRRGGHGQSIILAARPSPRPAARLKSQQIQ